MWTLFFIKTEIFKTSKILVFNINNKLLCVVDLECCLYSCSNVVNMWLIALLHIYSFPKHEWVGSQANRQIMDTNYSLFLRTEIYFNRVAEAVSINWQQYFSLVIL